MEEKLVGEVTHYYGRIAVAAIRLSGSLQVGDHIHILGRTSDFQQEVTSMQIEHEHIEEAQPGQEIGLAVAERVRENDRVYKIG